MVSPIAGLYQDVAGSCNFNFELHTPFLFFFIFFEGLYFQENNKHHNYTQVLQIAKASGLNDTAISMDNFAANSKFYQEPCGRKLKSNIENPVNKQQPLYLLFDAVHKFKNFCNNFLSKRRFNNFPPFMNVNAGKPFFAHIERA